MDDLEIDMALVCPLKPVSYDLKKANRELASEVDKHENRLFGAARIDPWQPDAAKMLLWGVESLGLKCLYLNPWEETFRADIAQVDELLTVASEKNIPFDTAGVYRQDFIEEMVEEFSGERVLFGSGAPYFDQGYELKRIQIAKFDRNNQQAVFYGNAHRLLDLKPS
jgi:predicted TIM-barrel fold metal-dependent hydrolase